MELPELPPAPPWALYAGPMVLAADAHKVSGFGRVWFSLLERPDVRYEFSSAETDLAPRVAVHGADETRVVCVEPVPLGLTSSTEGERTAGRHKSMNSNAGLTAAADMPPSSHGEIDLVTVARAHLLNFADPLEFGGCILHLGQWTATIRSIAMEKPRLQSFTPTHVVDLARSDEEPLAGSSGGRDELVESLCWSVPAERLAGPSVEELRDLVKVVLGVHRQVGALGQELTHESVPVLVRTSLPG